MNGLLDGYGSSSSSSSSSGSEKNNDGDDEPRRRQAVAATTTISATSSVVGDDARQKPTNTTTSIYSPTDGVSTAATAARSASTSCTNGKNNSKKLLIMNDESTSSSTQEPLHVKKRQRRWDRQTTAVATPTATGSLSNLLQLQGRRRLPTRSRSTARSSMIDWDKDYLSMKIMRMPNQHQIEGEKKSSIPEKNISEWWADDQNQTILGNERDGEESAFCKIAVVAAAASTRKKSFAEQLLDEHEFNNPHLLAKAEQEISSNAAAKMPLSLLMDFEQATLQPWETGDNLWRLEEEARQRLYQQHPSL
jgi:hypothetical protein